MATPNQLRSLQTAHPFRPFLVQLAGGRTFTVRHPENAACSPNGREMTVYDEEGMHLLEMLLVEHREPAKAEPAQPQADGNGE